MGEGPELEQMFEEAMRRWWQRQPENKAMESYTSPNALDFEGAVAPQKVVRPLGGVTNVDGSVRSGTWVA